MKAKLHVGASYVTEAALKQKIQQGTVEIREEQNTGVHACYLCKKSIAGQLIHACEHDGQGRRHAKNNYFLHKRCYDSLRVDEHAFAE